MEKCSQQVPMSGSLSGWQTFKTLQITPYWEALQALWIVGLEFKIILIIREMVLI